jgi:homopolymeric O-antigen transport system permease protein
MIPNYVEAISDILRGIMSFDMWGRMGWQDTKRRYRRTVIGPFWASLSLAIFAVSLGLVWANLWKLDPKEYLPYLTSGMMVWLLFAAFVTEGCTIFVASEGLIKQLPVPYSMLICAMLWRNLLAFAHNFAVYVPICIYARVPPTGYMLLFVPGIVALCVNGIWIAIVLGLLCARYRDIQQVVVSLLQVSMFVTPILWSPAQLTGRTVVLVDANLLYHYIEIVRDPLLGKPPSAWSWFMVLIATVVGWGVALFLFSRFRRRIPYWL